MAPAISVSTSSSSSSSSFWGCHSRCSVDAAGFGLHVSSGGSQLLRIAFRRLPFDRRALLHRSRRQGKSRILVSKASSEPDLSKIETRKSQKLLGSSKIWRNNKNQLKDNKVVFVAGASGKVGLRTVRELLKLGFRVRAGVRNIEKAKIVLQEAPQLYPRRNPWENLSPIKLFKFLSLAKEDQLEILECNLEIADGIDFALGNANVVICCIGASEKEVLDVTGPYRIDYQATQNLIAAATKAQVKHFVLVTSLGTTKLGWPASVLNLFWGVLIWKAKAENALQESGLSYTIVRPGGMERPTDAFKETHNLRLAMANSLTGGQVSNLQIAELLAFVAKNLHLAENKILEVVAEINAPLTPIEEMLAKIPEQQRDELIIKEQSGELMKTEVSKKEREVEEGKERELRLKFEGDILALKEEETQAVRKKLSLQKQQVKVLKQVEAATIAATQAKALANALVAVANKGQILTEKEKKKIMQSAIDEALSKKKTKTEPTAEALSLPPLTKSRRVLNQAMLPQDITVRNAQKISQIQLGESAKSDKGMENFLSSNVKSVSSELGPESSRSETVDVGLQSAQSQHNDKLQPGSETSCTELTDEIPKDKVGRKENKSLISNGAIKVDEKEGQEEQSPGSQSAEPRKIFHWFWQKELKPETLETDDTTVEKAKEERPTISMASRRPFSSYSRYPDLKPPASPAPRASVSQPSSITAKENGLDINRKAVAKLVATRERIALEKAKASLLWYLPRQDYIETISREATGSTSLLFVAPAKSVAPDYTGLQRNLKAQSPYTRYTDVKPPTSPSPRSPNPSKLIVSGEDTIPITRGTLVGKSKSSKAVGDLELEVRQPKGLSFSFPQISMAEIDQLDIRRVAVEKTKAAVAREALALKLARTEASFKWPWQRPPAAAGSVPMQVLLTPVIDSSFSTSSPVVGSPSDCLYRTHPLSPYTRYPDLKPPTTPTPISPVSSKSPAKIIGKVKTTDPAVNGKILEESKLSKAIREADSELSQSISSCSGVTPSAITEIEVVDTCRIAREKAKAAVAREALALQLARAETSFKWSWKGLLVFANLVPLQKLSTRVTEASVPASSPVVGSPSESVFKAYSLSPYTRYADLKPPTSPTPATPVARKSPFEINATMKEADPLVDGTLLEYSKSSKSTGMFESTLSHFQTLSFGFTPLTLTEVDIIDIRRIAVEKAKASVAREALALQLARTETSFQWPWQQSTVAVNSSSNQDFPASGSETKIRTSPDTGLSSETVYKAHTLSPYSRYSDLKPPTSSTPSAP